MTKTFSIDLEIFYNQCSNLKIHPQTILNSTKQKPPRTGYKKKIIWELNKEQLDFVSNFVKFQTKTVQERRAELINLLEAYPQFKACCFAFILVRIWHFYYFDNSGHKIINEWGDIIKQIQNLAI